jgi:hypothetical protein
MNNVAQRREPGGIRTGSTANVDDPRSRLGKESLEQLLRTNKLKLPVPPIKARGLGA